MLNLDALHVCNPSFAICLQDIDKYYIDLTIGRSEDAVKHLRRTIALSPNKPTFQILSGHAGSGKTTELLRLQTLLEQQGFAVIYFVVDEYLQIDDLSLTEIWLVMFRQILQLLENQSDSLSLIYLPNAIAEIEQWLRMSSRIGGATYVIRIQKILQALQDNAQYRRQLREYLEPRLNNLLLTAGEEVTVLAVDRLKSISKKGLVMLVDNLDRLTPEQVSMIFGDSGKYLRQFQCHTIYTLSLMAIAQADEKFRQRLQQNSKGNMPISLSNLNLRDRHGVVNPETLNLLRQVVLARFLPNIASEQRLVQVTDICDSLETLDHLCLASHGHLPYLLLLLKGCLQRQDPPISLETVNQVLLTDRDTRQSTISEHDRRSIQEFTTSSYLLPLNALNLCNRLLLFEYHDDKGSWFFSPYTEASKSDNTFVN